MFYRTRGFSVLAVLVAVALFAIASLMALDGPPLIAGDTNGGITNATAHGTGTSMPSNNFVVLTYLGPSANQLISPAILGPTSFDTYDITLTVSRPVMPSPPNIGAGDTKDIQLTANDNFDSNVPRHLNRATSRGDTWSISEGGFLLTTATLRDDIGVTRFQNCSAGGNAIHYARGPNGHWYTIGDSVVQI